MIKKIIKSYIMAALKILNYNSSLINILRTPDNRGKNKNKLFRLDMEKEFWPISEKCKNYTMTKTKRQYSLYQAIKYIVKNEIPGDIVECGVWRGGSMMLCAYTLLKLNDISRKIYLYDIYGKPWDQASLRKVKKNLFSTGYPRNKLIFVKGKVEDTIPEIMPEEISILRLDINIDSYESTYHELVYLFPILAKHGILIFDDYGINKKQQMATNEYFNEKNIKLFLSRIDYGMRLAIKL